MMSSSIASMTRLGGRRTMSSNVTRSITGSASSTTSRIPFIRKSISTITNRNAKILPLSSVSIVNDGIDIKTNRLAAGSHYLRKSRMHPPSSYHSSSSFSSVAGIDGRQVKIDSISSPTTLTIGILRETYDKWERRAPLTPQHVKDLLEKHNEDNTAAAAADGPTVGNKKKNLKVLVQPSTNRAFTNKEYEAAGATIVDDISQADVILGVKRPKSVDTLIDNKLHMFFSHVIKGQADNMELLHTILDKNITLIDYECIVEEQAVKANTTTSSTTTHKPKMKRMVAFGKYAGMAGIMDCFQPLGRRLLWKSDNDNDDNDMIGNGDGGGGAGYSTPFLNCPPAILHCNLNEMKRSVQLLSERIEHDGLNYDEMGFEPLVFVMTGKGGNVYNGVREIFDLLPHESISPNDLPQLYEEYSKSTTTTSTAGIQSNYNNKVYNVALDVGDIYQKKEDYAAQQQHDLVMDESFDRGHFYEHPSQYYSTFASKILPYTNVLVNCIYWDHRFPRLITKQDMLELYQNRNERLMVVADISCDVNGSIEFLERTTSIDKPFFTYDPILKQETSNDIEEYGVTMIGVDILPSELPIESSTHFGNSVSQLVNEFVDVAVTRLSQTSTEGEDMKEQLTIDISQLSNRLANACITTPDGKLTKNFKYLDAVLKRTPAKSSNMAGRVQTMVVTLDGHLFDSGLINQVLDLLEHNECSFEFKKCYISSAGSDVLAGGEPSTPSLHGKSSAMLLITGSKDTDLAMIESKIAKLVDAVEAADAKFQRIDARKSTGKVSTPAFRPKTIGKAHVISNEAKSVLLLGSGRVSRSVVDLLERSNYDRTIVVASDKEDEAKDVASIASLGSHAHLDVQDRNRLVGLIQQADVVISLLPAPMHPQIAELCIEHQKDLVTASYESDAMRDLGDRAKNAGIKILNEVGLDPGLDHMSAMRIIDDAKHRGGFITSFVSVCGGLPSPEAADNPLKYKFSWSPKGVISASQNSARYRWEDHLVEIYGKELLQNAAPFLEEWSDLQLECLPNRDSLAYEKTYGIENASTIFRGTLRYRGFSRLMHVFQNMGLFETITSGDATWGELLETLRMRRGGFANRDDFLLACADDDMDDAAGAKECLQWLGMEGNAKVSDTSASVVDQFCDILEQKLLYKENERDMVLMHHDIGVVFEDGTKEHHKSSLQAFGDESMTAMCKTVGYPTAAATELILNGSLDGHRGLLLPTSKSLYTPILDSVELEGIVFNETVKVEPAPLAHLRESAVGT